MQCAYSIEQALPHAAPMILLDEIVDFETDRIETAVVIRSAAPFFRPEGMPGHVVLEYMAQACAAMVGVEALMAGQQPQLGLLLGTRNFHAARRWIKEGERLVVFASAEYRDGEIGVFDCEVLCENEEIATAQVTVFQVSDRSKIKPQDG